MTDTLTYISESTSLIVRPSAGVRFAMVWHEEYRPLETLTIIDLQPPAGHLSYKDKLDDVQLDESTVLRSRSELEIVIVQDEGGYAGKVPEIDFDEWASTYQELIEAAHDTVVLLWNEYALEMDENLSEEAILLKHRIRSQFQEVPK